MAGARHAMPKLQYREAEMNWEQVEGKWKQYAGKVREKWGKLTDSDMEVIHGKRDQLIGKIQERYGIAKEEAQKQVDDYFSSINEDTATDVERTDKARRAGQP
jgi:uncharacterized protein YjbJ (UPF0337 family)